MLQGKFNIFDNQNQFQSQQFSYICLKSYSKNIATKIILYILYFQKQFLKSFLKIIQQVIQGEKNLKKSQKFYYYIYYLQFKMQSSLIIYNFNIKTNLNLKSSKVLNKKSVNNIIFVFRSQHLKFFLLMDDIINEDTLNYITLSNKCNPGINIQSLLIGEKSFEITQLLDKIVQYIYMIYKILLFYNK
ncbi:unnamed protein product [Paramecium sonneborni]|uniref:Uncharacterized protein n=1 Tax=Paramecium sonneborni TaxID=65129 RepID=A0A8S1P7I9_9CILI|nr:unnamed protein product [Paramecium sonneborni]